MTCLDANDVQGYLAGTLPAADRDSAEGHLDGCADCRTLVADLARGSTSVALADTAVPGTADRELDSATQTDAPAGAGGTPELKRGALVGRYIVTGHLGSGGMGEVYAAYDSELHRKLAIKLLRSDRRAQATARLQREARAMARVSHPNVISVFDVGTLEDTVFVAMELEEGGSLRAWLDEKRRSMREVLEVFLGAGRGLAAAHAAGLVHRDFKPDNVLVGGGRARVTDFGLASAVAPDVAAPSLTQIDPEAPLSKLTQDGAVMGTPAYMAPEQHEGLPTDAKTDQFAFCVALYEALYGERPFPGDTYMRLVQAVLAGSVRDAPRGSPVPASFRRAVLRGLSVRPEDRWPSMEALLAVLGRDRARVPRRVALWAAGLLAVVVLILGADAFLASRLAAQARAAFLETEAAVAPEVARRYEAFKVLSDLSYVMPVIRGVAGGVDASDFGLATREDDARALATLHENLASADWTTFDAAMKEGAVGVTDYKGRLLWTSDGGGWGADATAIPAVARAYDPASGGKGAMVLRGDDPALTRTGLLAAARPGLVAVFARATVFASKPRAALVQVVEGARLLAPLAAIAGGTALALVGTDGTVDGAVPRLIATSAAWADPRELSVDGDRWLVARAPVPGFEGQGAIAAIVLARNLERDVALAPLSSPTRIALQGIAAALLLVAAAALLLWRRMGRPGS